MHLYSSVRQLLRAGTLGKSLKLGANSRGGRANWSPELTEFQGKGGTLDVSAQLPPVTDAFNSDVLCAYPVSH